MTEDSQEGRRTRVEGAREIGVPHSELEREAKLEAEARADPPAVVLHEAVEIQGEDELARPNASVAYSGFAAGLTMGFSMIAEAVLRASLPEADWRALVIGFGYTIGFVFVTLGRQQLYTETTLTAALPGFHDPSRIPSVLRFWSIVLVANLAGTLVFAFAATTPGLFSEELREQFLIMGEKASHYGFLPVVLKGMAAGWIIAMMMWTLPATGSARILLIVLSTWLIYVTELTHVIVGSAEIAYAAMVGASGWSDYFYYVIPSLIGNSIGGVVFVGLLNHAQVRREK